MSRGDRPRSPWKYEARDEYALALSIEVAFDEVTHEVTGAVLRRDDECRWTDILWGVQGSTVTITIPGPADGEATRVLRASELSTFGFNVYEDLTVLQITAIHVN